MICKLVHTGKVATEEDPECLGYKSIDVLRLADKPVAGKIPDLIVECFTTPTFAPQTNIDWACIYEDLKNGYLKLA